MTFEPEDGEANPGSFLVQAIGSQALFINEFIADNEAGLLFKNKRDRKVINVDPKARPGDNSRRIELHTHEYTQVVLYDHVTRRKT